jgi:hypothetical protein
VRESKGEFAFPYGEWLAAFDPNRIAATVRAACCVVHSSNQLPVSVPVVSNLPYFPKLNIVAIKKSSSGSFFTNIALCR